MARHTDTTLLGALAVGLEDSQKDEVANHVPLTFDGSHNVPPNLTIDRLTIRGRRR